MYSYSVCIGFGDVLCHMYVCINLYCTLSYCKVYFFYMYWYYVGIGFLSFTVFILVFFVCINIIELYPRYLCIKILLGYIFMCHITLFQM